MCLFAFCSIIIWFVQFCSILFFAPLHSSPMYVPYVSLGFFLVSLSCSSTLLFNFIALFQAVCTTHNGNCTRHNTTAPGRKTRNTTLVHLVLLRVPCSIAGVSAWLPLVPVSSCFCYAVVSIPQFRHVLPRLCLCSELGTRSSTPLVAVLF